MDSKKQNTSNTLGVSPLPSKSTKVSKKTNQHLHEKLLTHQSRQSPMTRVMESLNSVQNTREVVTKYTYFPSYQADQISNFNVFTFGVNLIRSQQSSSQTALSRVKSVRAYVLQPTSIGGSTSTENDQTFLAFGAVPAEFLEDGAVRVGPVANTSNIVYPSLDPQWVKFLDANMNNVFDASTLQPVIRNDDQAVASLAIFNLDGSVTDRTFQLCIEVELAIPLGVDTTETVFTAYDQDFGSFSDYGSASDLAVMTQYLNLQNSF